jgi:RNA polymerase sigma factor (sigma-70 family)
LSLFALVCNRRSNTRPIRGHEIRQPQILFAIGGLIDGSATTRLVSLAFQPAGIKRLRIGARSERRRLIDLLIDPEFLRAEGPSDAMVSEEDGPELAVDTETPETILMNHSDPQRLQRAIDDLPLLYREALLLCEVEEMSYQQIGEILSIPIGTVISRLARARKSVSRANPWRFPGYAAWTLTNSHSFGTD